MFYIRLYNTLKFSVCCKIKHNILDASKLLKYVCPDMFNSKLPMFNLKLPNRSVPIP